MYKNKFTFVVAALILAAGVVAPVGAQESTVGRCAVQREGIAKCWDDQTSAACTEKGGDWLADTVCADISQASWDGACLTSGGEECCVIDSFDSQFSAGQVCESERVNGEWFPRAVCEDVPVELQSFDVER